jgi:hypothetical protein
MYKVIKGQETEVMLCNFTARIVEDITKTNGAETERSLAIVGEDENGYPLKRIVIPLEKFDRMDWPKEKWNMNCVIESGYGCRDNLRQAIQSTAKYAERKTVYGTTGWWNDNRKWIFCMPGDESNTVELSEKTKGYSFRRNGSVDETLKVMKTLPFSVAPERIMIPIIAYSFGSILNCFSAKAGKEPKTVIILYGKTGSMKTTLAQLVLSLFGRFDEDNIPMNFRDTPKSILDYCFTLKDCAVVIDDYHPGSSREQSKQDMSTQALIRGICNREARGALDKSGKQRAAKRPQCNAIMTAEYLPNVGESGTTRFFALELKEGDINIPELTEYQGYAADGTLSHFTYLATEMIKEKYLNKENGEQELVSYLKDTFLQNREFFRDKAREYNFKIRPRLCEDIANLEIGWELYCSTLQYYGAITKEENCLMFKQFTDVIMPLAIQQQSTTETEQPSQIFIRKLGSLIDMGKVSVVERFYSLLEKPRNLIGYSDEDNYYFETDEAFAAVSKACNDVGEHFPLSRKALLKALKNEGISICSKGENTRNVRVSGGTKRLLCIPRSFFEEADDEDTESEEDLPFGPGIVEESPEQLTI